MLPVRFTRRVLGSPLLAWDPFRALARSVGAPDCQCDSDGDTLAGGFDVDVREDADRYTIEANLPGIPKDAVELTFEDGVLTIAAQTGSDEERQGENFHVRERRTGRFSRCFRLPSEADPERVGAKLADGVLTVTVEKVEAQKPRKIDVQAG